MAVFLSPLRRLMQDATGWGVCERCGAELEGTHEHLADVEGRHLLCVCHRCAGEEPRQATPGPERVARRTVPDHVRPLPSDRLTDDDWDAADIPVGIAFFFYNSLLGRAVACYPGPAGATESQLPAERWQVLVRAVGAPLEPDVEALLARRTPGRREAFVVPITACYELVGRIRRSWRGFGGGAAASEIDAFFDALRARGRETS